MKIFVKNKEVVTLMRNNINIQPVYSYNRAIDLMSRVFANGPGDRVQSQIESYQRLKNGT